MKRFAPLLLLFVLGSIVWFSLHERGPEVDQASPNLPAEVSDEPGLREFVAVDTSRLMSLPYPFELQNAFPKLNFGNQRPLQLSFAPHDPKRVFVLCQEGKIHVFLRDRETAQSHVFLDLSEQISRRGNEEGLLGIAFHPQYEENGLFFVCYSAEDENKKPSSVIAKFRVSAGSQDQADPDSAERVLEIPQPFRTQNGGSMEFGPDGYLYIGLGDGGSANDPQGHGQNLGTLLGSILRIDVDHQDTGKNYAVPQDNPFVSQDGAAGEIWAYGFRNVWRLAFDRKTGTLWAGDVGQNRVEEVDIVVKGGNYGWNRREGTASFSTEMAWANPWGRGEDDDVNESKFVKPITDYYHSDGRAVVGGRVYRGSEFAELDGEYLYGDFFSGNIWALSLDDQGRTREALICNATLQISGFGEDYDGELYMCAFDGNIYRLQENEDYWGGASRKFPFRLSETGLFESTQELKPVRGMIPYSVNVPLWSDGSHKERYVALPKKGQVDFSESGIWKFPVGTVLVKTFFLDMKQGDPSTRQRLETRLLVHGRRGWDGYSYHWNDQTDATLMEVAVTIPYEIETPEGKTTQNWYFPSRSDCKACHTQAGGVVLSTNTRQLNRTHAYDDGSDNQLRSWDRIGVFREPLSGAVEDFEAYPDWQRQAGDTDRLARAYLDVNCAFCHAPGGPGNAPIDLRYHTPLGQTVLIGVPPRTTRYAGEPATAMITRNRPGDSELVRRMELRGPGQMPIMATFIPDKLALAVVKRWITELPAVDD